MIYCLHNLTEFIGSVNRGILTAISESPSPLDHSVTYLLVIIKTHLNHTGNSSVPVMPQKRLMLRVMFPFALSVKAVGKKKEQCAAELTPTFAICRNLNLKADQ